MEFYEVTDFGEQPRSTGNVNFLTSLFDFTFSRFVTEYLIQFFYALAFIVAVFAAVSSTVALFSQGLFMGLFSILLAPLAFLLVLVVARLWLETMIVLFRIASYLRDINEKVK